MININNIQRGDWVNFQVMERYVLVTGDCRVSCVDPWTDTVWVQFEEFVCTDECEHDSTEVYPCQAYGLDISEIINHRKEKDDSRTNKTEK